METRKPRVIIADDEGHIRAMMKAVMNSMQCEIAGEAANGEEAVNLFKKEKPDLLLLDINMPIKTGEEALKEIIEDFPDALVIMLTSVADMESIENCINLGAANYIRKDTPLTEIKNAVRETWRTFKRSKESSNV